MGPAVRNPGKVLYGRPGVPFTAVWWGWWYHYSYVNGLEYLRPSLQGAPFGADYSHYPIQPMRRLYDKLFLIFNEITAYNLIIFIGFFSSALSAYILAYFLTRDAIASIIAGLIFSFSPFHLMQSTMNLWLATTQWIPLYFLSLFLLLKQTFYSQKGRNYVPFLTAGLFTLVLFENYYYGYMAFLITAGIFLIYTLYFRFKRRIKDVRFKPWIVFCVFCIIISLPAMIFVGINFRAASKGLIYSDDYIRSIHDLNVNSARWFDYFIPPFVHPVWGKSLSNRFHPLVNNNVGEKILFVGIIPLLLAGYAVSRLRKGKTKDPEKRITGIFFLVTAFLAFILSFPMASRMLHKIFPMFRVYSRFGVFVILGISILAALGARELNLKRKFRHNFSMSIFLIPLIIFEFINFPPYPVIQTDNIPQVYRWLSKQPSKSIIVEYPLAEWDTATHYRYLFYQRYHRKLLFNGIRPGTAGYNYLRQAKVLDKGSIEILKEIGIKYIIIHKDYFTANAEGLNTCLPLALNELKLIKAFGEEEVYEIKGEKN